jgi:hypothetical protein
MEPELMGISADVYPIEDITRVFELSGASKENSPRELVFVAMVVPLTVTVAPSTGKLVLASVTVPWIARLTLPAVVLVMNTIKRDARIKIFFTAF